MIGRLRDRTARALGARQRPAPERRLRYLVSPAGYPNFGDEYIARAWLEYLARTHPEDDVVLDCHTPGQAGLLLRGVHPRAVFTDTLWRLAMMPSGQYAAEARRPDGADVPVWDWAARAAQEMGLIPRLDAGMAWVHRADSIHLLGGGYINSLWQHHAALVTAVAAAAERTGAAAFATGQGLVPAMPGAAREAVLRAAEAFEVFDVRDGPSEELLAGVAGRSRTGDDAWLAAPGPPETPGPMEAGPSRGEVVLCLQSDLADGFCPDGEDGPGAVARWTRRVLDAWGVDGREVSVVEGMPGYDRVVYDHLEDRLAGARFIPFLDVWREGLPAGPGQTWISTRFHPHLLASAAGASGVAVLLEPGYYDVKHRSLIEAGSRWVPADGVGEVPARPDTGGFGRRDRTAAVDGKRALAARLYPPR